MFGFLYDFTVVVGFILDELEYECQSSGNGFGNRFGAGYDYSEGCRSFVEFRDDLNKWKFQFLR